MLSENAYGEYYAQTDIGTPIYMAPEALAVGNINNFLSLHTYVFLAELIPWAVF